MTEDSKKNERLFIYNIICFTLFLGTSLLALYITPHMLWDLHYEVPSIVTMWRAYFENDYDYSTGEAKFLVWCLFAAPGLIFGLLSYYFTQKLNK